LLQPYPAELAMCRAVVPRSASTDTISGVVGEAQRNWSSALIEVLERAVSLGRWDDSERVLNRAKPHVEERLAASLPLTRDQVAGLTNAASRLAEARGKAEWGRWALALHAALGSVPPPSVTTHLSTLPAPERELLAGVVNDVVESVRAQGGPKLEDKADFARVSR
jgi:hypothetical protein